MDENKKSSSDSPYETENKYVIKKCREYEKLEPTLLVCKSGDHENIEQVETLLDSYSDIKALKVHSWSSHTDLDVLKDTDFVELSEEFDIPIICHTTKYSDDLSQKCGVSFHLEKYCDPKRTANLAKETDANIIAAHAGRLSKSFFEDVEEVSNLYFDVSPASILAKVPEMRAEDHIDISNDPKELIESLSEEYEKSIVWGSDFPLSKLKGKKPEREYRDFESIDKDYKKIINKNSEKLFF